MPEIIISLIELFVAMDLFENLNYHLNAEKE